VPEGDTIFRAARRLSQVLAGEALLRFEMPRSSAPPTTTPRVLSVDAVGKYLVVRFDDERTLVTHMKMNGSWHVYRRGERWRKSPSRALAILETARHVAICFDAPVVRLLSNAKVARALATLGPDLLSPAPDLAEAARRVRDAKELTIAEALLSQSLVAGIGNEIKSEALFLARLDPRARVRELPGDALARVLDEARKILLLNVAPTMRGPRRTRGGKTRAWVYGRAGEPCLVCATPIARIYQGPLGARRSTYFCPTCVAPPAGAAR
jgi:endonuclease VIII